MKFGIVVFPGSNCDFDAYQAIKTACLGDVIYLWHGDNSLQGCDVVILPGGFSYGDYLRSGAISHFSPIMKAVVEFANKGGTVIGICNGFQILLETGLLPGAMRKNIGMRFVCKDTYLKVENNQTQFTKRCSGTILKIPIAHAEGNYFCDSKTLKKLNEENRVVFRYTDSQGNVTPEANPNGALDNIAGIINSRGNVLGMMPHPERACEIILGSADGRSIFESIVAEGN
jgi:phosphoribosylformylglycinamidine synthase subunit PurQ / glutaminase